MSSRMKKAWCDDCGYTVRLTVKWIMIAVPRCPVCDVPLRHELEHLERPDPNQLELMKKWKGKSSDE